MPAARPCRRQRPLRDQRSARADGIAAGRATDRDLLGAAPQQYRQAAWRWPQRRIARTRRARACRQGGDGRWQAKDAGALCRRACGLQGQMAPWCRRCLAVSHSSSMSIALSLRPALDRTCRSCGSCASSSIRRSKRRQTGPAHRSELPLLRHRAAAWHRRTRPSRTRLHDRRLEILRTRADLSDGDRLRAGALGRCRPRRR